MTHESRLTRQYAWVATVAIGSQLASATAAAQGSGPYIGMATGLVVTPKQSVLILGNERMLIMSDERITALHLPDELLAPADDDTRPSERSALKEFRDQAERDFIIGVLRKHKGNVSQSAIELGVGRPYLHKRLAVLKIRKKDFYG